MVTYISFPDAAAVKCSASSRASSIRSTAKSAAKPEPHQEEGHKSINTQCPPLGIFETSDAAPPPLYTLVQDAGLPQSSHSHEIIELTRRPATPPPFPDDLPNRGNDNARKLRRRKRLVVGGAVLIAMLMICIILVLAILLGGARKFHAQYNSATPNASSGEPGTDRNLSTIATTPVSTATTTLMATIVVNTTATVTVVLKPTMEAAQGNRSSISLSSSSTAMSTLTTGTMTTSTPTPSLEPRCDDPTRVQELPFYIAAKQCVLVNECTERTQDVSDMQCKDFCRIQRNGESNNSDFPNGDLTPGTDTNAANALCRMKRDEMTARVSSCCSLCGCFGNG